MENEIRIKRRVKKGDKYVETTEKAKLVKNSSKSTVLVMLSNGDIIKRKRKDVIIDE